MEKQIITCANSSYPQGGVSCSNNSFVVIQTLVFQINFCGKSPALRVAAKPLAETLLANVQPQTDSHITKNFGNNKN